VPQVPNNGIIAKIVRLAFHDCTSAAGCDGCVNLDIHSNAGLAPAVIALESVYTGGGVNAIMSRADFW
jgi:hypothetical protein